ncbi:MAG TPA: hypothetical protein PKH50_00980 [bacterium]|jgi:hypothetical protein|nr:hypothetical protein [bacterium]
MITVLTINSPQAVSMLVEEFKRSRCREGKDLVTEDDFFLKCGVYHLYVETPIQQEFFDFVKKSSWAKPFFSVKVVSGDVCGFPSEKSALKAVDVFNKEQSVYFLDPCDIDIEKISCHGGYVYAPVIFDNQISQAFWSFVRNSSRFSRILVVREEKIGKRKPDEKNDCGKIWVKQE